jgi:AcrR family transcriptional regulator
VNTKPASQARSRDKRDRVLAALDTLLRQRPFTAISVSDLAHAAQVSPATLYQRFSNEDALGSVLLALYFARCEEWARRPRPAMPPGPSDLRSQLRSIAAGAWDQMATLGHVMRPAYLYSRQHPERTGAEWRRLEQVARDGFRAFLHGHATAVRVPDIDQAADTLCDLFNFMLLGPLLHHEAPRWHTAGAREDFANTLAELAGRYLQCAD